MGELILEIVLDAAKDTIKLVPFLFVAYLFLEWMEHQTGNRVEQYLEKHRHQAPLVASLFGLVPECGFSTAASSLYTTGIISAGTLIAVFLSTSDEMLPIMLAAQVSIQTIVSILAVKVIVAIIAGYIADHFSKHEKVHIDDFCEREHCDCEHESIFKAALEHTIKIAIWMFGIAFVMTFVVEMIGMDALQAFLSKNQTLSVFISAFIGLIPSCASSITLTTLYLDGVIGFAEICAGLLANSGIGMAVLFRVNPNTKNNLLICFYTFIVAIVVGLVLKLIF